MSKYEISEEEHSAIDTVLVFAASRLALVQSLGGDIPPRLRSALVTLQGWPKKNPAPPHDGD